MGRTLTVDDKIDLDGLTAGKLREWTEGMPDDTPILASHKHFERQDYQTPAEDRAVALYARWEE